MSSGSAPLVSSSAVLSGLVTPVSNRLLTYAYRNAFSDGAPDGSKRPVSVITPLVSVPVLSLHSVSICPKFWMLDKFLTITCCFAMRVAPLESVIVVIIGRNSGVKPTASATANSSDSSGSRRLKTLTASTNSVRNSTICTMNRLNDFMPRSNSVSGARRARLVTMPPNAVREPVAVTSASARPLTTLEPTNTRSLASAGFSEAALSSWLEFAPTFFSTGSDSPVSAACCTCKSLATSSRASAGTSAPAVKRIRSPGTISLRGNSSHAPSRLTVAVGATCTRKPSAAICERRVCAKSSPMLPITMAAMMPAFSQSPEMPEISAAISRIATSGCAKYPSNCRTSGRGLEVWISFGPTSLSLSRAA